MGGNLGRYPAPDPAASPRTRETPRDEASRSRMPASAKVERAREIRLLSRPVCAANSLTELGEPQSFDTVPLGAATLAAPDKAALLDFQRQTARLQRAVLGSDRAAAEAEERIAHLQVALRDTPGTRRAGLGQAPLAAFMVAYTVFGLWLLASPRGL